jgi:hypothetical protein
MTIPLPKLPTPDEPYGLGLYRHSPEQIQAIQREAMRAALEAAAKVCDDLHSKDTMTNYFKVAARELRQLRIEGETP